MPCFYPLRGYRSRIVGESGKRKVVFSVDEGFVDLPVVVACGQCNGCRLERSRQWAVRCMHEASLYERNCFVTLTYSPEHLPAGGTLVKKDFQDFMKRLRRRFPTEVVNGDVVPLKIRFFHCGEYGDRFGRPHYHVLLFNFDFDDKYYWATRKANIVWRSKVLEELWPFGQSEIGSVTFDSAAYVARYIFKKVTGDSAKDHYESVVLDDNATGECHVVDRVPEYTTMSRGGRGKGRGGIGNGWWEKYRAEVYPADNVVISGRAVQPPRFYFGKYELLDEPGARAIARRRKRARNLEDETPERLAVREKVLMARLSRLERDGAM